MSTARSRAVVLLASAAVTGLAACSASDVRAAGGARSAYVGTDSMGMTPPSHVLVPLQARRELVENSAAALSHTQPGVWFTINDSGNDPWLFALDTTGADRGAWRVSGATNVDWESASVGPCSAPSRADTSAAAVGECVYIGDTGDNDANRPSRVIYRVREPVAQRAGFFGDVTAASLPYRYSDGPHDVEAMYAAPNGDLYLITKRRLRDAARRLRPALVFRLDADAWGHDTPAVAALVDSLPIVPGSAPLRQVTDAGLSPDANYLAVRTYGQVYVFATDSVTGRVRGAIPPTTCNIALLGDLGGEGVTWFGRSGKLLLTTEGRDSPMRVVVCPLPRAGE